eukprot:jgi/Galph1/3754/GphlegSOOS_G2398.1
MDWQECNAICFYFSSVVLLFVSSLLGIGLPLIQCVSSVLDSFPIVLLSCRAFGTGIVLATGFIHLLGHAYEHILLSQFGQHWKSLCGSVVGFVALLGALVVQFIEFIESRTVRRKRIFTDSSCEEESSPILEGNQRGLDNIENLPSTFDNYDSVYNNFCCNYGKVCKRMLSSAEVKHSVEQENSRTRMDTDLFATGEHSSHQGTMFDGSVTGSSGAHKSTTSLGDRELVIIVLEFGIAFHSFIIGTSLGVLKDEEFRTLLTALIFHQFFEGMALSSVILQNRNVLSGRFIVMSVVLFSCVTPIGTVFGILLEMWGILFVSGDLFRGISDAASAGVLIYTGLVELLTYQFTLNVGFQSQSIFVIILSYTFFILGMLIISLVSFYL